MPASAQEAETSAEVEAPALLDRDAATDVDAAAEEPVEPAESGDASETTPPAAELDASPAAAVSAAAPAPCAAPEEQASEKKKGDEHKPKKDKKEDKVPEPKFTEKDKPELARRVAPLLVPSVKLMAWQIEKTEADGSVDGTDAMLFCIPQVEHLSKVIAEERVSVVNDRIVKDASAKHLKTLTAKKTGFINSIRFLSYRTNVQMAQYELSSR